jgi:ABC-type phosphate/phosphonate transport system substrate-binding protein
MHTLIANARMYAVTPTVRNAWRDLFEWVGRHADVSLAYIEHAAPAPLDELWSRGDLGVTFMCGFPFASAAPRPLLIAAPIPSPPRYRGQPVYCTDFIVPAGSGFARLTDTFSSRIGWTASHSQSGFNAVRHHLLQYRHGRSDRLFAASVGPLVTPRRVIEAVLEGVIDVGPLVHDLLKRHEPGTASKLRTIESTLLMPIPPLIASSSTPLDTVGRLRRALLASATDPEAGAILKELLLAGFAVLDAVEYDQFLAQALEATAEGYQVPS